MTRNEFVDKYANEFCGLLGKAYATPANDVNLGMQQRRAFTRVEEILGEIFDRFHNAMKAQTNGVKTPVKA